MDRRKCIRHEDEVFYYPSDDKLTFTQEIIYSLPFLGLMVAGYFWMISKILGVI